MAAPAYAITRSPEATAVFCLASMALDIDHIADYFFFGERPFSVSEFLRPGAPEKWDRIVFLLHSYEFIVLMAAVSFLTGGMIIRAVAAGFAVHLLMDEAGNRMPWRETRISPFFYFLSFRAMKGFRRVGISRRRDASA